MFGFRKKSVIVQPAKLRLGGLFSTHPDNPRATRKEPVLTWLPEWKEARVTLRADGATMDDDGDTPYIKPVYGSEPGYGVPPPQLSWYASQGFIGYQVCALLSQHWLIEKACAMPGADAVRNGWDLTVNDGTALEPEQLAFVNKLDKKFKVKWHLWEYMRKGRIFGIRVMMYKVDSPDPNYYALPFNIDGVTPGSYKGMVQIDPYWITPEMTTNNLQEPDSLHFYEPEYWRVGGKLIHRTHLVIFTTGTVPDVLKPSYFYGGVSIPQRIYERVYAAERSANEAPQLLMTKRSNVLHTDMEEVLSNLTMFAERMEWRRENRDNYGTTVIGLEDVQEQFDLTLTDCDGVILTQYQLVAAEAEVPGTKLLGTQPKGFNSTGEFEEASYHERLETMQEMDLTPVLDRHYMLIVQSYVKPKFNTGDFAIDAAWNELDAMTALEQAQINGIKAGTGAALIASGAIESQDERDRLIGDKDSGYDGLSPKVPQMPDIPGPGGPGAAPPTGTRAAAQAVAYKAPSPRAKPVPGA